MKSSKLLTGFRLLVVVAFIAVPVLYAMQKQEQTKAFRVVDEGILYRSGQMTVPGLKRIIHDYGIRTVVSLRDSRDPGEAPPDAAEEEHCRKNAIKYVRITPHRWQLREDGTSPADEGVQEFLSIMRDPKNHPVLVHCFAGIHRSGAYSAIYRMEHQNWSNKSAIAELYALGYDNVYEEKDILGFLQNYKPRK